MLRTLGLSLALSAGLTAADFTVVDGVVYDPEGIEFIAKGVNVQGPGFNWAGDTPAWAAHIVDGWGCNAIRLNCRELERLHPDLYQRPTWNGEPIPFYENLGTVAENVAAYTGRGCVVILEEHEQTGSYHTGDQLTALAEYWAGLARIWGDQPLVWLNPANEPGGHSSAEPAETDRWVAQHQAVIDAVRAAGGRNVIVIDCHFWGQDVGEWNDDMVEEAKSALLGQAQRLTDPLDRLVFAVHFYDQWVYGVAKMEDYLDRVRATGRAVIVGEYPVHLDDRENPEGRVTRDTLTAVQPRHIGRLAWSWWEGGLRTDGTRGGTWTYDADGRPEGMSARGELVWHDLHRSETLRRLPPEPFLPAAQELNDGAVIEAENFDRGGEGAAYHDEDAFNHGGAYRPTAGVDLQVSEDVGGGHHVGWMRNGEWLRYTVAATAGTYRLDLRLASGSTTPGHLRLRLDDEVLRTVEVPATGGWQTWTTVGLSGVAVTTGNKVLRVEVLGGNCNFDRITCHRTGAVRRIVMDVPTDHTWTALSPADRAMTQPADDGTQTLLLPADQEARLTLEPTPTIAQWWPNRHHPIRKIP